MIRSVVFATGHVTSHCIPQSLKTAIVTSVHSQPASQTIVCDESRCRVVPGQHPTASCVQCTTRQEMPYTRCQGTQIFLATQKKALKETRCYCSTMYNLMQTS